MFYQLLIGSWPTELLDELEETRLEEYRLRVAEALRKSLREAKLCTTWSAPNAAYEDAMLSFARDALDPSRSGFLRHFLPFLRRIARLGVQNSLAETVMKLTLPGTPDLYQGSELWNLSLVDPDNRRPVDYGGRDRALTGLLSRLERIESRGEVFADLLARWPDGRVKLAAAALLLRLRRDRECLFREGGYVPIAIASDKALGYLRVLDDDQLAVLVARFPGLRDGRRDWGAGEADLPDGRWIDELSGRKAKGGKTPLAEIFDVLPVAVLRRE
jgi:(1->4)-alpha-D-glucan 1-alpha-D-glucosylmutase